MQKDGKTLNFPMEVELTDTLLFLLKQAMNYLSPGQDIIAVKMMNERIPKALLSQPIGTLLVKFGKNAEIVPIEDHNRTEFSAEDY